MKKPAKAILEVKGTAISILSERETDYISLTDIARYKNADATDDLIRNWLRNRNTVEFLGIWEQLHNPGFNPVEFDGIPQPTKLEGIKAEFIHMHLPQGERLTKLNTIAIRQMKTLTAHAVRMLEGGQES
jgi:hypothetical protein